MLDPAHQGLDTPCHQDEPEGERELMKPEVLEHDHPLDECGVKDCRFCRHHNEDFHSPFHPHWHEEAAEH
jgi:hypothetical protein